MKNIVLITFLSLFVITFSACKSTSKAKYDFNSDTDFSQITEFKLIAPVKSENDDDWNPILNDKVEKAIKAQLIAYPLTYSPETAEMEVTYSLRYKEQESNSSISFGVGGTSFGSNSAVGLNVGTTVPLENTNKTVTIWIDMSLNGEPIWHGNNKFDLSEKTSDSKKTERIIQTVTSILANYPPVPKS